MKAWLRKMYLRLPVIKELARVQSELARANQIRVQEFFRQQLAGDRYQDARKLNQYEHQVFSQNGEDGILDEIFRRIGCRDRFFVEFGVGDGLENNTVFLLSQGWRGCWIEGDPGLSTAIRRRFGKLISSGRLKLLNRFVTAENIEALFRELQIETAFDLLSLDIDRNTYHVWKALSRFQPRVVAIEYNAAFPARTEWIAQYDAGRVWNNTMYFGASLKAYERLGDSMGYALVGCDLSGTNAFFVNKREPLSAFADPFTAENHYEPPRYWSVRREAHARCFDDAG